MLLFDRPDEGMRSRFSATGVNDVQSLRISTLTNVRQSPYNRFGPPVARKFELFL